jgi:hypothetical protein
VSEVSAEDTFALKPDFLSYALRGAIVWGGRQLQSL